MSDAQTRIDDLPLRVTSPVPLVQCARAPAGALAARFPAHPMRAAQLHRPDLGGDALIRAGFRPLPLHPWLMRRPA